MENKVFDVWALVQLFGHSKIAGRCTEQSIAGGSMLRVEVPETKRQPSFTRFFNVSAIYSIDPMTEEVVRAYAETLDNKPIQSWDINEMIRKLNPALREADTSHDDSYRESEDNE